MWEKINHAERWRREIGRIEKKGKNKEGRGGSRRRVFLAKKEGEEEEKDNSSIGWVALSQGRTVG